MGWVTRLRFGPGIAGKLGTAFIALLGLLSVAIFRVRSDWFILLICLIAVACAYWFADAMLKFAREHPGPALLEGQHLITYQGQELAAKNRSVTLDAPQSDPVQEHVGHPNAASEGEDG